MDRAVIYQISGLHIRYPFYEDILFAGKQIRQHINEETIAKNRIVLIIVGDIFEYKSRVSQYDLHCFHQFIGMFPDINIITIPGYHDFTPSKSGESTLDLISAALISKYSNVQHFARSGIYTLTLHNLQLNFHVASPIDKGSIEIPLAEHLGSRKLNIGLSTNLDPKLDLNELDLLMLGSDNRFRFLANNAAYAGSLIQYNKSDIVDHGYIRWQLQAATPVVGKFVPLLLRRAYITVEAANNNIISKSDIKQIHQVGYVTLIYKDCTPEYIINLRANIKKSYGRLDNVKNISARESTVSHKINKNKQVLDRLDTQLVLLAKILQGNEGIDEILELHKQYSKDKEVIITAPWQLNYLYWSNIFCYGEDNYIDFRSLSGVTSLIGNNGIGKSTVIDVIFFALYNKKIRGDGNLTNTNDYRIVISFSIGADEYIIYRTGNDKNPHVRLFENMVDISEPNIITTYKRVNELIGEFQDLEHNNIAIQDHHLYVNRNCAELKSQFLRYLGLDKLREISESLQADIKLLRREIKLVKQYTENIPQADLLNKEIIRLTQLQLSLKDNLEKIRSENYVCLLKIIPVDDSLANLQANIQSIQHSETEAELSAEDIRTQIQKNNAEIANINREKYVNISETEDYLRAQLAKYKDLAHIDVEQNENDLSANRETIKHLCIKISNIPETVTDLQHKLSQIKLDNLFNDSLDISQANAQIEELNSQYTQLLSGCKETTISNLINPGIDIVKTQEIRDKLINNIKVLKHLDAKTWQFAHNCAACQHNQRFFVKQDVNSLEQKLQQIEEVLTQQTEYNNQEKELHKITKAQQIKSQIEIWHKRINLYNNYKEVVRKIKLSQRDLEYTNKIREIEQINERLTNEIVGKQEYDKLIEKLRICLTNKQAETMIENLKQKNARWYTVYNEKASVITWQQKIEQINQNEIYRQKVMEIEDRIAEGEKQLNETIDKIIEYKSMLHKSAQNEANKEKCAKLEHRLSLLKLYYKAIDEKAGLPYLLARKYIGSLQEDINSILANITNFQIELVNDEKGGLNIYSHKESEKIASTQMSGSQKFIIDLAIRICLVKNHPFLPKFIMIDEGFGCMDQEHLNNTKEFIANCSQWTQFLLIISHIEEMHVVAKTHLLIDKEYGKSKLVYGDITSVPNLDVIENTNKPDASVVTKLKNGYQCLACNRWYKGSNSFIVRHIITSIHLKNYAKYKKQNKV